VYHLTTRGVDRLPIVLDDEDREYWMALRAEAAARFEIVTYAFCLMGNHWHAIVGGSLRRVSRFAHRLNGLYAQGFNTRRARSGHLFGQRPDIRVIADDEYLDAACAYVRANPVRAGLCASPRDWPWAG
jgi:REP element-mobilizing transposase RayT